MALFSKGRSERPAERLRRTAEEAGEPVHSETEEPEARQARRETEIALLRDEATAHRERLEDELATLRDQHRKELSAVREELANEQRARKEAEARLPEAQKEAEAKIAQVTESQRRIDDAFDERLSSIFESQESARRERVQAQIEKAEARAERERLQTETEEASKRRAAEVVEAERRVSEAHALLEEVRAEGDRERERLASLEKRLQRLDARNPEKPVDASVPRAEPTVEEPISDVEEVSPPIPEPAVSAEPSAKAEEAPATPEPAPAPEVPDAAPEPAPVSRERATGSSGQADGAEVERRVPEFHQPPPAKREPRLSLSKRRRERKLARERADQLTCAVTGREAPTDSEWELRRQGWVVSGNNALSPEAQADGWQFPEGAALPFRKLSRR